ncbi:MAG: protein-L-isoaspartate(D-aspartate) O-methyltransferase [candidate division WOR-3 bacterium]
MPLGLALPDLSRMRQRMVENLTKQGITSDSVLKAMAKIPRHMFIEDSLRYHAYETSALPIACGQTISSPLTVAVMLENLELTKSLAVLEIGTGSGYLTALLAELTGEVFTIEHHTELARRARAVLCRLGYPNIHYRVGDGVRGWPEPLEFDRIIATAAGDELAPALVAQLKDGGRAIFPIGDQSRQDLMLVVKQRGGIRRRRIARCRFVPLVSDPAGDRQGGH